MNSELSHDQIALLRLLASRRLEFLAFLRRRVRAGMDPEDLLQQALLVATAKIGQLRDPELVGPWFYRIMRRALADHHAASSLRERKRPVLEAENRDVPPETPVTCACSLGLVDSLPAQYADVLRRVDVAEEDLATVASSLGTTTNNATVRLHRARKALRRRLLAHCGTTSARSCLDCACGTIPT
jgi:RNA polymerase sigma-70 factor (ECF subfamily)